MTLEEQVKEYARKYNDRAYFVEDPISGPRHFLEMTGSGGAGGKDVEVAAVIAAHLAWGRRQMIVRDIRRAYDEMGWKPYDYVMRGSYRCEPAALHRTVKWSEFAQICGRLRQYFLEHESLETLTPDGLRTQIYGQKSDLKAANKKIHMMRRWMVRRDGIVDFGIWKDTEEACLIIPLDTHVHTQAREMGITTRNATDFRTADEITEFFRGIFPSDPCLGDFALFGLGVAGKSK